MRVQATDQGHPIPCLSLQQPVVVEPLHELVLPLEGEATADFVQPEGSKEMSWSQMQINCDSADPGDTISCPNEALQCCVNVPAELCTQLVYSGISPLRRCAYFSQNIPMLVASQLLQSKYTITNSAPRLNFKTTFSVKNLPGGHLSLMFLSWSLGN